MKTLLLRALIVVMMGSTLHAQEATSSAEAVGPAPYVAMVIGSSVDLATTLSAIRSGRGREGNPFLAHIGTPGLVAWKSGATVGLGFLMKRLGARGHPRLAKTLGYAAGVALGGLGYRNSRVGK